MDTTFNDNDDNDDNDNDEHDDLSDEEVAQAARDAVGWGRGKDGKGCGRKKGAKNLASRLVKAAIQLRGPEMLTRLFELAGIPTGSGKPKQKYVPRYDGTTAIAALKMLMAYGYGRPTVHVELSGETTRTFAVELPPTIEHEEWMKVLASTKAPVIVNPPKGSTQSLVSTNGHGRA